VSDKPDDLTLVLTCSWAPEQYEVFSGIRQVGYLRLRHGEFTVECPNAGGVLVYSAQPKGDGRFDDDERAPYLSLALSHIREWLTEQAAKAPEVNDGIPDQH